jgi:hypothetical protein
MSDRNDGGAPGIQDDHPYIGKTVGDDPKYWLRELRFSFGDVMDAEIDDREDIKNRLIRSWPLFGGPEADRIARELSVENIERLRWKYPKLTFKLLMMESVDRRKTRAPLLTVEVDTIAQAVSVVGRSSRSVKARQAPIDVHEAAYKAIFDLKFNENSEGLRELEARVFEVNPAYYMPEVAPARTCADRRRRFRQILAGLAVIADLEQRSDYVFSRRNG